MSTEVVSSVERISKFATSSIANSPQDEASNLIQPYAIMDEPFEKARSRLILACEIMGLTPTALAAALGVATTTITRPINRRTESIPNTRTMELVDRLVRSHLAKLAVADHQLAEKNLSRWEGKQTSVTELELVETNMIRVGVRGFVQAGQWSDAAELPLDEWEYVVVPKPDGHREYFGLKVKGNSMDVEYPPGTILVCVPVYSYNGSVEPGDHLIVHRWNEESQVEATVKELLVGPDNRKWLCPKSTDPTWSPILIPDTPTGFRDSGNTARIEVVAIVVADYRIRKRH